MRKILQIFYMKFGKAYRDELKTFILARRKDTSKSKLSKKGKLADAIKGETCYSALIWLYQYLDIGEVK